MATDTRSDGRPLLACESVTKTYGGLVAVKQVSFAVQRGEIFAVVGPNGAGKTTLFEVVSGFSRATSGTVFFDGQDIHRLTGDRVCRLGLSRTFQTTTNFRSQTVFANAMAASLFGRGRNILTLSYDREAVERALRALDFCGLAGSADRAVSQLSTFEQKRLMLATALATEPRLLLLDEPVGGLNAAEREGLISLIRDINASGVCILMIEHVMKAVQALADRMLVLDHGEKIVEGDPDSVLRDPRVGEVYLGSLAGGAHAGG
jgi:branched-chain amino acid transport system ATP-binding protein